jgi:L-cysteine S-thiosulfotransferase
MKLSLNRIIPFIMLALLAAGCSKSEETPPPAEKQTVQPVNELTGEALFNERCRDCHTVHDKGGVVGPNLSTIGAKRSPAYLEQVIREPSKTFPGTVMPPYDTFSTKQVNSLVDYLGTLK